MICRAKVLSLFLVAIGAFAPLPVGATIILDVPLESYVARSTVIVRATVLAQQILADEDEGRIATVTEVHVREALKGRARGSLLVRQPGGELGTVEQRVADAARFKEGEEVVLFLEPARDDRSLFVVLGMSAGKYRLAPTHTGELRATRDLDGLSVYRGESAGPGTLHLLKKEDHGEAETFLARIRALVRRGEPR